MSISGFLSYCKLQRKGNFAGWTDISTPLILCSQTWKSQSWFHAKLTVQLYAVITQTFKLKSWATAISLQLEYKFHENLSIRFWVTSSLDQNPHADPNKQKHSWIKQKPPVHLQTTPQIMFIKVKKNNKLQLCWQRWIKSH